MTLTAFYKTGELNIKVLRDLRLTTKYVQVYGPLIAVAFEPNIEDANLIVKEFKENPGRELITIKIQPYGEQLAKQGIFKVMTSGLVSKRKGI